jgi:hypothetical protein
LACGTVQPPQFEQGGGGVVGLLRFMAKTMSTMSTMMTGSPQLPRIIISNGPGMPIIPNSMVTLLVSAPGSSDHVQQQPIN